MSTQSPNLEQLDGTIRPAVQEFADRLKQMGGPNALALTVYGAAVAGAFDRKTQSVRSVLVLGKIDLDLLRQISAHGTQFGKEGIAAPLIMTLEYIGASQDTFPLEMIEIMQMHVTVFGEDYFTNLAIQDSHVRLQCERELKVLLIGLRQGLLASAGNDKMLGQVTTDMAEHLVRTMRGLLWLEGRREPLPAPKVLDAVEGITERKLPGIRAAMDRSATAGWTQFRNLYEDVDALGTLADVW